jgi:hypothetical protein
VVLVEKMDGKRRSEDQDSVLDDDDDEVMELLKRKVAGPALARLFCIC